MINFDEIKRILEMMREHDLAEFEFEREGLRVRLKKDTAQTGAPVSVASGLAAPGSVSSSSAPSPESAPLDGFQLAVVKSPVVGTFFRAAEPGATPFVEVGDTVRKGQVLCIIEAMKLMNEIDSEYDGEIVNIFVDNGQPVQYAERLFAIRAK